MPSFRLRIADDELLHWAGRYSYPGEAEIEERVAPMSRDRGWLTREEFRSGPVSHSRFQSALVGGISAGAGVHLPALVGVCVFRPWHPAPYWFADASD